MWPVLIAAGLILLVLSQHRLGSSIMENLNIYKPGPKFNGTVQLAYLHWVDVRVALGLTQKDKTALAVARSWRSSGLSALFSSMGYDWRAVAAISLHETGYGTSHAVYTHDNLWGVSFQSEAGPWVPYAYDSMAHAAEHLLSVLNHSRYNQARAVRADGPTFLKALNVAGYNSLASWRAGVLAAYGKMLLQ
jgi:hypothetical protein